MINKTDENKEFTTCPHCGKEISTGTMICPYCQKEIEVIPELPEKKESRFPKILSKIKENKISVIILLISLIIIGILARGSLNQYYKYYNLQDAYQETLNEIDELQKKYEDIRYELENYQDQQDTINSLNEEVADLQEQVEALQSENSSLKEEPTTKHSSAGGRLPSSSQYEDSSTEVEETVYWTTNGDCYHSTPDCATLKRSSNITSGSISSAGGRRPCKVCH